MEVFRYSTKSMNTDFEIQMLAKSELYAKSAAYDLFAELERLEGDLSMFIDGSSVSMMNSLKVGEIGIVMEPTLELLAASMYASNISKGAIDVCMGEFFLNAKNKAHIDSPSKAEFEIDAESFRVRKLAPGKLDFGAIGKGFALDVLAQKLVDAWEIDTARLTFGGSSQLALNTPEGVDSWNITFAGQKVDWFKFKNCALGSSGTAIQGMHILDCRSAKAPENPPLRTWAICDSATVADAMSTAFMILSRDEISEICESQNIIAGIQESEGAPIEWIGKAD